jgi:hypothetical protein
MEACGRHSVTGNSYSKKRYDGKGIPLGSHTDSAASAEVRLAEKTLQQIKIPNKGQGMPRARPKRVIGDKAYDSDPSASASENGVSICFLLIVVIMGITTDKIIDSGIDTGDDIQVTKPSAGSETFDALLS